MKFDVASVLNALYSFQAKTGATPGHIKISESAWLQIKQDLVILQHLHLKDTSPSIRIAGFEVVIVPDIEVMP